MRWMNEESKQFLVRDYLLPGQSVEDRVRLIADTAENYLQISGFADKLYSYVEKGWISFSTPVWVNYGTDRGLPISCFGSYVDDNMDSILYTHAEIGKMTQKGGGTAAYFGAVRSRGTPISNNGQSSGSVHFMQMFDSMLGVVSQGATRRGTMAVYLPIDHPDIEEFLTIRDEESPIKQLNYAITIKDSWMEEMVGGDQAKREVWAKVLESRARKGYPYLFFVDAANRNAPEVYREQGMEILHSQVCSEISLPTNNDESFVCCLSSMNLVYFDEWKDTDAVETLTFFLDSVMTEFINKAQHMAFMDRAVRFARNHRALGVGVLGFHSYLQSKMIPFESMQARWANAEIFKTIEEKTEKATRELAVLFGEPEVCKGYGKRNTTLRAIAPTKSSSFILGQASEGIEPEKNNYYVKDLAKIRAPRQNPYLKKILADKGYDTEEVWMSILKNRGSVQHLSFLSSEEKEVFKTFEEISPMSVVLLATQRQKFLDQTQSVNLIIPASTSVRDMNTFFIEAWRQGIVSLYYQFSSNAAQDLARSLMSCQWCEG